MRGLLKVALRRFGFRALRIEPLRKDSLTINDFGDSPGPGVSGVPEDCGVEGMGTNAN
jgi:hypothetical protein